MIKEKMCIFAKIFDMDKKLEAFQRLLNIMEDLRKGCPWDKKQTIESLRHLTIEETYELSEAILASDYQDVKKELGDLIMHIVFYSTSNVFKAEELLTNVNLLI